MPGASTTYIFDFASVPAARKVIAPSAQMRKIYQMSIHSYIWWCLLYRHKYLGHKYIIFLNQSEPKIGFCGKYCFEEDHPLNYVMDSLILWKIESERNFVFEAVDYFFDIIHLFWMQPSLWRCCPSSHYYASNYWIEEHDCSTIQSLFHDNLFGLSFSW